MYQALEACATDFNNLPKTLADPARIKIICAALDAVAKRIGETPGETEVDRNNLTRLYRGMLATKHIISRLQEKRSST